MGRKWDKNYLRLGVTIVLSVCACMVFYEILKARANIFAFIGKLFSALAPVLVGVVLAFLLNPIMIYIRRGITWCVMKIKKGGDYDTVYAKSKLAGLIITLVLFIAVLVGFLNLVIPSLYESLTELVNNTPTYLANLKDWVTKMFADHKALSGKLSEAVDYMQNNVYQILKDKVMPNIDTIALRISSGVMLGFKVLLNCFVGIIVTVYLLYSKDVLLAQGKKIIYCVFSKKTGNKIMRGLSYANQVFGGFINGKIIDSVIIGIICFAFTAAVGMKYASLISVLVGVTNIIPFFGPFIGAVPGALLALMDDPIMFVIFLIWVIVLQQFDGNILGPLILGDATGLSSLWVLAAILVGGSLFGVPGMILGVPVFACIYAFIAVQLRDGLRAKKLSSKTEDYFRLKGFDEETGEPIYMEGHETRQSIRKKKRKQLLYNKLHHIKNNEHPFEEGIEETQSDEPAEAEKIAKEETEDKED